MTGEEIREAQDFQRQRAQVVGHHLSTQRALYIDAKRPIADKSAYTVIVARTVEIFDGPNWSSNSDYEATDVPVPKGVGPPRLNHQTRRLRSKSRGAAFPRCRAWQMWGLPKG